MSKMAGPKKIIDLDDVPESKWETDPKALYLHNNKLWTHQAAGCVLCADAESTNARAQTLRSSDEEDRTFVCLTHGQLEEIPFFVKRSFQIKIGSFEKVGDQVVEDTLLVPASLPNEERNALYAKLIAAAADVEQADDLTAD